MNHDFLAQSRTRRPLRRANATSRAHVPFVVLFQGRAGSSWLLSLLNQQPSVMMYEEILAGHDHEAQLAIARRAWQAPVLTDLAERVFKQHNIPCTFGSKTAVKAIGFKTGDLFRSMKH